jgi:heme-degrading monooxygenase HmoA
MMVIVFRSRARAGVNEELTAVGAHMYELATAMPGFMSYKDYQAPDGENVSIVEFDTPEHLEAWRNHPEHRAAQARARELLFTEYNVQVCSLVRQCAFP